MGRARRGVSGALYSQPAIARLNSWLEVFVLWDYLYQVVLKAGSCAAERYEPRQVRKEAAVNSSFWVPQGFLVRANWWRKARESDRKQVHDPRFIREGGDCLEIKCQPLNRNSQRGKANYKGGLIEWS